MAKRKYIQGWEWVRDVHFDLPAIMNGGKAPEESVETVSHSSRAALGSIAIGAGLLLGVIGLLWWQHKQDQPDAEPQVAYVPTAAESVRSVVVRVPRSRGEVEKVIESAKLWMEMLHEHADEEIAVMVWNDCWRGVVYPGRPRADDHASVAQVHGMVRFALAAARAERDVALAKKREAELSPDPLPSPRRSPPAETFTGPELMWLDRPQVEPDEPPFELPTFAPGELDIGLGVAFTMAPPPAAAVPVADVDSRAEAEPALAGMVSERPTPGYYYRIDDEIAEHGVLALASLAVLSALLEAAHRKGWSADKVMTRGQQIAETVSYAESYEELVMRSKWNEGLVEPLRAGMLVWLPPIRGGALLSRSRQPRVSLDPRPWADGSSRVEPPPSAWTG